MIFLVFGMVQMQFFQNVEASFRSRFSRLSNNHELPAVNKETSSAPKCSLPCQLESFWISFDKVLEMSEIPSFLHPFLRSKSGDMIDVGKCYGSCNYSYKQLYPNLVSVSIRSTWWSAFRHPILYGPLKTLNFKNMQTRCVPIGFEDIKTEIIDGDKILNGPTIENLVIRNCACAEVQSCE